jgi:hypothetical protein
MTVGHGAVAHHATWTGYRFHAEATAPPEDAAAIAESILVN